MELSANVDAGEPVSEGNALAGHVVVIGVAGAGKTTIGIQLGSRLGKRFIDADSLHPTANVSKMEAGTPLEDADRWPWLASIREALRGEDEVVLACSALKRQYRDLLRGAGRVRFVYLDIDGALAEHRLSGRAGHFMGAGMVSSQLEALEPPTAGERDVVVIDADDEVDSIVATAIADLAETAIGDTVEPILADGGTERDIDAVELARHIAELCAVVVAGGHRRVLLVPPDQTRAHSRAGLISVLMSDALQLAGCEVGIMPALGTHAPVSRSGASVLFGPDRADIELLVHDWRSGLRRLGEIGAVEVGVLTADRFTEPIEVAVSEELFNGWDLIVSIGQVVPHEVIGMANFTKNLMIGLGGAPTIHRSHFVGAIAGMETIMGRVESPVRDIIDAAFDRFLAPELNVMWVLTVVADAGGVTSLRGLYAGQGGSADSGGAAFRTAAALARRTNVTTVARPLHKVVCWLDPVEYRSTWLGNKAVYRTRMAIADGGELVVLAPGVTQFGEDDQIDLLIRKHGYRGTAGTLAAVAADPELADNLSAAAHLVHGSSEGRFRIVYCTDPAAGGLSQAEVEGAGFEWRPLADELDRLQVGESTPTGERSDLDHQPFYFVANPALGLWSTAERLDDP